MRRIGHQVEASSGSHPYDGVRGRRGRRPVVEEAAGRARWTYRFRHLLLNSGGRKTSGSAAHLWRRRQDGHDGRTDGDSVIFF